MERYGLPARLPVLPVSAERRRPGWVGCTRFDHGKGATVQAVAAPAQPWCALGRCAAAIRLRRLRLRWVV